MKQHPQARKRDGHTGRGQALVLEGARVKWVCRKGSVGMGHFVGAAHPLLAQGGGDHPAYIDPTCCEGLTLEERSECLRCLCSAFANGADSLRSSQGLCPPGVTSSVLLCSSRWESWWRCCPKEMDTCLCSTELPCSWCSLSQMKQGAVLIQFAQSLCIPSLCALFLESSQHFLEFL